MINPFTRKSHKGNRGEPLPEPNEGLPDSHRPSGLCPRCGKQSTFQHIGALPVTFGSGYALNRDGTQEALVADQVSSLICRHCQQGVAVIEEKWVGEHPERDGTGGGVVAYRGVNWWPLPEANLSPDIPRDIADVFDEAAKAFYADCPRASVVMARRTLEAIAAEKGETTGDLASRLASLTAKGDLHPTLAAWAKEVRLAGNLGAHFDPARTILKDDASHLLRFTRELMRYMYELPAELQRKATPTRPSP